jgi:4-amino-4-deoxy-L-arabinose transferase-like glycosyltransferase
MNTRSKKSCAWALVLVALGLLALYGGPQGLALLVPAAILVWYVSRSAGTTAIDPQVDNRSVRR